jgi:hypothetical protein
MFILSNGQAWEKFTLAGLKGPAASCSLYLSEAKGLWNFQRMHISFGPQKKRASG